MTSKADLRTEKLYLASKAARSPEWPKVKRAYLKTHPGCAVCNGKIGVTVHHILPYWKYPELELDPTNFITLCEYVANHHLFVGHLMNWLKWNTNVVVDAAIWNERIAAGV
jgi:hypothetical protein